MHIIVGVVCFAFGVLAGRKTKGEGALDKFLTKIGL